MNGSTFRRYEPDPRLALFYAHAIALRLNQAAITPEHLLIGATIRQHAADCDFRRLKEQAPSLAGRVGVRDFQFSAELIAELRANGRVIPLSASAKRVLARTRKEANKDGQYWIDVDHLLLGLLEENGLAARALAEHGWTANGIRASAAAGRARYPRKPVPAISGLLFRLGFSWLDRTLLVAGFVLLVGMAVLLYLHAQNGP